MCNHHLTLFSLCGHYLLRHRVWLSPPCSLYRNGLPCIPNSHPLHTLRVHSLCLRCGRKAEREERLRKVRERLKKLGEGVGGSGETASSSSQNEGDGGRKSDNEGASTVPEMNSSISGHACLTPRTGVMSRHRDTDTAPVPPSILPHCELSPAKTSINKPHKTQAQTNNSRSQTPPKTPVKSLLRPLKVYPRTSSSSDAETLSSGNVGTDNEERTGSKTDSEASSSSSSEEGGNGSVERDQKGEEKSQGTKRLSKIPLPLKVYSYSPER